MRKILAIIIVAGLLIAAVPALSPPAEASVYNYDITSVRQTGPNEVTVSLQVLFCSGCNPNYLSSPGCYPFTHGYPPPSYPYRHWCGGLIDGRYVAVRLRDEVGNIIGATPKLACNQINWPINQLITRDFVFPNVQLSGVARVTAEADVYCSWCGHWYPQPKSLEVAPLRVVIDPGHACTDTFPRNLEHQICKGVADRLKLKLEADGIDVYLTDPASISDRVEQANALNPAIFVSLHGNALQGFDEDENPLGTVRGSEVWCYTETDSPSQAMYERDLGTRVLRGLTQAVGSTSRGLKESEHAWPEILTGMTVCPAVLVEMEFYDYSGSVTYDYDERVDGAVEWAVDWADGPPNPAGGPRAGDNYVNWCLAFVQDAYQYGGSAVIQRYEYAKQAANALGAANSVCYPPRGSFVFYDSWLTLGGVYRNWGHVGISLGDGQMIHAWTDGPVEASYDAIGLDYIGWAWPPTTPPVGRYDDMPTKAYDSMKDLMTTAVWQEDAAQGIYNGIIGYFDHRGLTITAKCPIDLLVTDPDGLRICKDFTEIPGASYSETEVNGDQGVQIRIPERKLGDYLIEVVPKPDALPTDTFTLEISLFGVPVIIARNVSISDIPTEPYLVISTEEGIIPPTIGSIIDFDPDVLNLRTRGGVVTAYIELPEGYDVGEIDVSSIRLNGTVPALEWPYEVGDYNDNGIPDLMVKFDRRAVHEVVEVGESVEITITGEVDGIPFMGVDTIRVIGP